MWPRTALFTGRTWIISDMNLPGELSGIIQEELGLYLSGSITKDMLIDHLENRVELYLGEMR